MASCIIILCSTLKNNLSESDLLIPLVPIPFGMGVLLAPHIRVSVTQPLLMVHPYASQLNYGPLYFMTDLGLGLKNFGSFWALILALSI